MPARLKTWLIIILALIILVVVFLVSKKYIWPTTPAAEILIPESKTKVPTEFKILDDPIFKSLIDQPRITTTTDIRSELGRENPFLKF